MEKKDNKDVKVKKRRKDNFLPHEKELYFILYYAGLTIKHIAKKYNIVDTTLYRLRDREKWEERKEELRKELYKDEFENILETKRDLLKVSMDIVKQASRRVLQDLERGSERITVNDLSKAVNLFLSLSDGTSEKVSIINSEEHKKVLEDLARDLSPEQRAIILDINKKLQEKNTQAS